MATTRIAFTDTQLDAELTRNREDLEKLRERLRGEQRTADAAKSELSRVVDAIERGVTGKEVEHSRAKDALELANIRVKGIEKLVAPVEAKITELSEELGRRADTAARAARKKEFAQRVDRGKALALRIREAVALLCTGDMRELEELRANLVTEFPDLGGIEEASGLREIVVKLARPSEGVRNPEVHLAKLEAEGLEPFGFYVSADMLRSTVQGVPDRQVTTLRAGAPVRLTVVAMRPRD
jgi:hypothetical protein